MRRKERYGTKISRLSPDCFGSVAIPSLFLYFIFNQKLSDLISQCESLTELFLHQLMQLKRKSANAGGDARPAKTAAAKPAGKSAEAKEDE